jgi:transposase
MRHIAGHDRSQTLLLPESLDEYVGPENPVRFIEAFVDGLDLTAAGFARVTPKVTGRPGYAPTDLLKLYIYGYLNRVRSSRRLEAETHRNIEVIWLLNQGAFLMRGLENVRAEFSLTALAYNLRRVLNLVGFTELMAALTA